MKPIVDYLQLITDIGLLTDPDVILRKILEFKQMKPAIHKETLPYIGQLLREMPEMWEIPFFKDALNASQQQGALHNQQRTLIRLLQHKFTQVPENVMQKIQSTTDLKQLDNWQDQIIVAKSLGDTCLIVTEKNDNTMNKL
jgi:hypothetical protein